MGYLIVVHFNDATLECVNKGGWREICAFSALPAA